MDLSWVFLFICAAALIGLFLTVRRLKELQATNQKQKVELTNFREVYEPILSIEDKVTALEAEKKDNEKQMQELRCEYREKRDLLDSLRQQVAIYDERLSFAELGVYEPHFDFGDSEIYKKNITETRDKQKMMVSAKTAVQCPNDWTVNGSAAQGRTMVNRQMRLTLRAFNNECEAAIANTRWNNVTAMEKRILNAAKQINSANSSMKLEITRHYIDLKLKELFLTHEYREQLKREKDERSELARAEREEKKLLKEAEAAEKEEQKYQELLKKAHQQANIDTNRVAELEAALAEAKAKGERARAMSEMTKSGYIYIISNIGSFGEDMVKIGLTRRLDPQDRVRELGDASVPFSFDTHAMIYSDEAPALEAALHKEFESSRVNKSNPRKEFFHVTLDDVEKAVQTLAPDAQFFKDREAQEWFETLAYRKEKLTLEQTDDFPRDI